MTTSVTFTRLTASFAGRYRIERELGRGGMATVYLAEDVKHDRKVAIKVLKPELAAVLGAERFVVEIKTTAALQHPHILPLFDSGTADGLLYYVMPYVQGETVRDKLNRETQFGVEEAVRITREIADALDYAHRRGVIHRDIKPENILLHDGRAMVMDFGIALAVSAAAGGRMTETGLSLGTPHYMSPEQATAEKEITPRSDIYSLASVLYEMLAGQPPHVGGAAQQVIMRIITEPARPVDDFRKNVSPHVTAALAKALEKLPGDRFETAKTFADALGNAGFALAPSSRTTSLRAVDRRATLVFAALSAVLAVALAASLFRDRPSVSTGQLTRFRLELADSFSLVSIGGRGPRRITIAPNGERIVYVGPGTQPSLTRLWTRRMGETDPVPIAGTDGGSNPAISPDGRRLAFIANLGAGRTALRVVPVEGGAATTLSDSVGTRGLAWGRDGYLYVTKATIGSVIYRIAADGSGQLVPTSDTSDRGALFYARPFPLPSGKGVLVTMVHRGDDVSTWEIGAVDLRTRAVKKLVRGTSAAYAPSGHLLYATAEGVLMSAPFDQATLSITGPAATVASGLSLRGGGGNIDVSDNETLVYLAGNATRELGELYFMTRDGNATPVDTTWRVPLTGPLRVSPDHREVAVTRVDANDPPRVWIRRLDGAGQRTIGVPGDRQPSWSPDGRWLATSNSMDPEVHLYDLTGTSPPVKIKSPGGVRAFSPEFTANGKQVVFDIGGGGKMYIADIDGRTPPAQIPPIAAIAGGPVPSPDGKWLAHGTRGRMVVRPMANPESAEWIVSDTSQGAQQSPRWSRDSRELFFMTRSGNLMSVPVIPGPGFSWGIPRVVLTAKQLGVGAASAGVELFPDGRFLIVRPVAGASKETEQIDVVLNASPLLRGSIHPQ